MEIAFLPLNLARWDDATGDVFAVGVWQDVRPLRGAAGLIDWRLCGQLSRWMREDRITGTAGEKTLLRTARLPWRSVLALGLGDSGAFTEQTLTDAIRLTFETMAGLGWQRVAMALPGRESDRVVPGRALELLQQTAAGVASTTHFTVVDVPVAIRSMAEGLVAGAKIPVSPTAAE